MKMYEEIKNLNKDYVYEQYTRIVEDFKSYEKITKTKMLEAIYKVYDNPNNIIDICTTKELKYLKMVLNNKISIDDKSKNNQWSEIQYLNAKYDWERKNLSDKFLLDYSYLNESFIPEEIIEKVKEALKRVKLSEKKKIDDLNVLLVSYCKIQGSALLSTVCQFASSITGIDPEVIWKHMLSNKLFNYYVLITFRNIERIGEDIPVAIYQDYYDIEEELDEQRKLQGLAGEIKVDPKVYETLFYNDFDINNPKLKKFLTEIKHLPFLWNRALKIIKEFAMLNIDREPLKKEIKNIPALKGIDLTDFFKTLDEAMDEMPSGALNGFTPNEAKEIKTKQINNQINKIRNYVKQQNACLSKQDAQLFYKIYFGLLEFTNKKYKINEHIKIYKRYGINPYEIQDIVDKFWDNKDAIILEFCFANPYKFNKEELTITREFKQGIRSMYIIAKYELEYTDFMTKDRIYMVKGINDNIDNIIPYTELPYVTYTTIIPFKGNLIYDSMLLGAEISLDIKFDELVEKEYDNMMKYYHL